jgi:tricorn protease-like protein
VTTGQTTSIQPPADVGGFGQMGSARFSPDASRVAFALARGDSSNEQGWVAVSDGLSGGSRVVATSEPGRFFTVVAWLNQNVLLLQSNTLLCNPICAGELWRVNVNGSGLTKVADGAFVALVGGDQ